METIIAEYTDAGITLKSGIALTWRELQQIMEELYPPGFHQELVVWKAREMNPVEPCF